MCLCMRHVLAESHGLLAGTCLSADSWCSSDFLAWCCSVPVDAVLWQVPFAGRRARGRVRHSYHTALLSAVPHCLTAPHLPGLRSWTMTS